MSGWRVAPALAVTAATLAAAAAVPAAQAAAKPLTGMRDARYCEVFEVRSAPPTKVVVWNTIGLNRCPASKWTFDAPSLAQELGDVAVVLNGPRHWLMDRIGGRVGVTRAFHGLRMRRVATIPIATADELTQTPYTDRVIHRTTTWSWNTRRTVFELVAPGGDVYVMQSYAQIKDPSLTLADLPGLARRLTLPPGWRYRTRTLRRPLVLPARGSATILQDDLQDTYQLAATAHRGKRRARAVDLTGQTRTVAAPATPGTVEDHGTVSGTPFGDGTVVLVARFGAGRITGTVRLTFPKGQIVGKVDLPFTISGNAIAFDGTTRLVSGTGAFRGITSGALHTLDHNTLDGQNGHLTVTGTVRY